MRDRTTGMQTIVRAIAALTMGAAAAAAQTPGTVKIGNEVKKTSGVVVSLEAGDVACYVTLKDDAGKEFNELADFSICETKPSLVGKRVALTYKLEKVMADECQGNPDCTKTKTVALIIAAKVIGSGPAAAPKPAGPKQASFCTPLETVVFSCRTGTKMVSVCASKDASARSGYVQYRFGPPASRDPLELTVPADEPLPPKAATGENVPYSGGGASWLRFKNGPYAYVVYTGIGNWGPNGSKLTLDGVAVERGGKTVTVLPCNGEPTTALWPDWYEKTGITARGEEFDLPIDWSVRK